MAAPLLFVGDIHLGRSPHRLQAAGLDSAALDPAEAWRRVVRYALEHQVQAVVLAGDVVDQDKDRFEAWGHLSRGVRELTEAGIGVLGVAGNHDSIALPRLADRISAFRLLGRAGTWERAELDGVDLIGWSFPKRHHRSSPLDSPGLTEALEGRRTGTASIGVLHGDLDASDSPYAPVRSAGLRDLGLNAWFLGHIHQPGALGEGTPLGYLGSLIGLDRSEQGPRGPWLVSPTSASALECEQLALGPVYWTSVQVDLSELQPGDDVPDRLHAAIESAIRAAAEADTWLQDGDFDAVGCSVRFVGRTGARRGVAAFVGELEPQELVYEVAGHRWAVVHIRDETRPAIDLAAYARQATPVGQVAQLLLDLDTGRADAVPSLVQVALDGVQHKLWTNDDERYPLPNWVDVTRSGALRLLDQLLDQQASLEVR